MKYNIKNETSMSADMVMKIEGNLPSGIKKSESMHLMMTIFGGEVDAEIGRLVFLNSIFHLWESTSFTLLSQYVRLIESVGTYNQYYFNFRDIYDTELLLPSRCTWGFGLKSSLTQGFFVSVSIANDGYVRYIERFSLPIGVLPYAGLAATIFFHGMALFGFIGRLLLPRIEFFSEIFDAAKFPFTTAAMMGSLLTLVLFSLIWLFVVFVR